MCGICGIVVPPTSSRHISGSLVERMRDTMVHRGPDGAGVHLGPGVGLGHRRLSIIDVAAGAQPMHSTDGHLHIAYNGEVFNHPSLKRELEGNGVHFRTRCDTETVLHLYERDGPRCPEVLRGMFAIAIWDDRDRSLFLARDRFGVKPLYYHLAPDGTLVFASEVKAILASAVVRAALNERALPDYLANHAPSGADTLFAGIKRLPPAHTLRWRDGQLTITRYWELKYHEGAGRASDEELVEEFRDRFTEAVKLRLMSDVPLGMFLSGGIDSAAITAAMSTLVQDRIKTFSVAFAERDANELAYARLVARTFNTDHHEVLLSPEQFLGAVPRLVWHEDEPMAHPSSVALNAVSQLAARHVKVVLTGEGSDEMLAGYGRYRTTIYNLTLGRRYEALLSPSTRQTVRRSLELLLPRGRFRTRLGRTFLARDADLDSLYFDNFAVFDRRRQAALLAPELAARVAGVDPYAAAHAALAETNATTVLDRLLFADVRTYMHELLMKQDQMSMAASIESRVPFLDHPLAEFLGRLPTRLKLRGLNTKYILRKAMADVLPAPILARKKMGFPVPFGAWMRGAHAAVLDEFVLGARARARAQFEMPVIEALVADHRAGADHAERLWALVNFEVWQRMFLDGESPGDILVAAPAAANLQPFVP